MLYSSKCVSLYFGQFITLGGCWYLLLIDETRLPRGFE